MKLSITDCLSIQADIDGVDHVAMEMEAKWGRGRLRLLVPTELRELFDLQAYDFNKAVREGDVAGVRMHAGGMARGWQALDRAATEAGCDPVNPEVWETTTPEGEVVAIVRTNAEAAAVTRDGRKMQVWTIAEIGRLVGRYADTAGLVKSIFDGATVAGVRIKDRPPAEECAFDAIDEVLREPEDVLP